MKVDVKYVGTIGGNENVLEDFILVTDSQDVAEIKDYFGLPKSQWRDSLDEFDGFFVKTKDGDYHKVFGFHGNVPYNWKSLYEIRW